MKRRIYRTVETVAAKICLVCDWAYRWADEAIHQIDRRR